MQLRVSPSVTVDTVGTLTRFLGDISCAGPELAAHLPVSAAAVAAVAGRAGRCLTCAVAELGPQVLPFTPSPGTE